MTTGDARIRHYRETDRDVVLALVEGILFEFGFDAAKVARVARDLDDPDGLYRAPRSGFWVAERDGHVVGSVAIRRKDDGTAELKRLYLRADERGTGLGQRLFAHAETFARLSGYTRLWLDSSRRFGRAHRLYQRNGFVLVAELDNDWEDSIYEKSLV